MTGTTTQGLLLHLSAPLQSWGESSRFNERDTGRAPTRSGLIGLLACAMGRTRNERPGDLTRLRFTVRIDRPGSLLRDFHTVGGGMPKEMTVITAEGKRRTPETATVTSSRYYLQDAAFTVVVTGPSQTLDECAEALRQPAWPLYLGRRACPPNAPLLLASLYDDPIRHLLELPVTRPRPGKDIQIEFRSDTPLTGAPWPAPVMAANSPEVPYTESQDEPVSFTPADRRYRPRPVYRLLLDLPADRCAGLGTEYLKKIIDHFSSSTPTEKTRNRHDTEPVDHSNYP